MSALQLNHCNTLIDRQLVKVLGKNLLIDKDGNTFMVWHEWQTAAHFSIKNGFKPGLDHFPVEICRLLCTGMIDQEGYDNLIGMLKSPDKENFIVALQLIKNYRKMRLAKGKKAKKRSQLIKV